MIRKPIVFAALLTLALAPGAWAMGKGTSMIAIQFTDGTADLADVTNSYGAAGFISSYRVPELGVQAQYWYLVSDDYAMTLAAGLGFSRETDKPGQGALPGASDETAKTSSFNVRIGGDRVVKVGERAVMYGGPGVEFWSGKAKYENYPFTPTLSYESQRTKRVGFSARLGGIMMITRDFGLAAHVGHRFGYATVTENDSKATWWPSSFDGAMGLILTFGGSR
jgi:hypothetical protein